MTLKNEDILQLKQDEYISDIIDIEINSRMSVSILYALETIFYLRLQLEHALTEKKDTIIEVLCRKRLEQLANALIEKYTTADSVSGKIEILERIEVITLILTNEHSDFALEEASMIVDKPNLTYAQELRLKWFPGITPEDEAEIVAELLPQTNSSFEMATLALISDFCNDKERASIIDRYIKMFNVALAANNTAELGCLLALAAYWNIFPSIRPKLTNAANHAVKIAGLSLPEKRVNAIAAAIYAQIQYPRRQIRRHRKYSGMNSSNPIGAKATS